MRASPRALLCVCGLSLLGAGCVSPPRAVAPTTLLGAVPVQSSEIAGARPTRGSATGPLTLIDPRLLWIGPDGQYRWQVVLSNGSQTEFGVAVVFELLDAVGRTVAHDEANFVLGGGKQHPVLRQGTVTAQQRDSATHWRIEYWVRLLPPPERRVRRSG